MAGEAHRDRPTGEQLRVWRDYFETARALEALLETRLQSASGISSADYHVLVALSEAEGRRLRSSELADRVGWERSRLSHHLRRMERRDLIRRESSADDSRGSEVVLTEAGARAYRDGSVPHMRDIRELFVDAFEPEQLSQMAALTAALRRHIAAP